MSRRKKFFGFPCVISWNFFCEAETFRVRGRDLLTVRPCRREAGFTADCRSSAEPVIRRRSLCPMRRSTKNSHSSWRAAQTVFITVPDGQISQELSSAAGKAIRQFRHPGQCKIAVFLLPQRRTLRSRPRLSRVALSRRPLPDTGASPELVPRRSPSLKKSRGSRRIPHI